MEFLSQSANTLGCASGSWKIWSLSDGYVELPAESIRYPNNKVCRQTESPQRVDSLVRLSVNCFLFDRSGIDRVLIDCGAGESWDPSMGHLEEAMAEAGIDTSSITMVASPMLMATTSMVFLRPKGIAADDLREDSVID